MSAKKVFETDGLAGDWAQPGGVQNADVYEPIPNRYEKRSKTAKDFNDYQRVNYTDIAGTGETNVNRVAPEGGVYASAVAASLTTSLTGTNNDLVFTAKATGPAGNNISVTYVDPGGTTATLGVVVTGTDIVVNLGRAASAINTTGTLLKGAIDGSAAAAALVSVANSGADDGTGLVTAMAKSNLSGGSLGNLVS